MKNYIKLSAVLLLAILFTNCNKDEASESILTNHVGFEIASSPKSIFIDENATQTFEVDIYATEESSSERSFGIVVDEDVTNLSVPYSVPTQVTIPANSRKGTLTYTVTDDNTMRYAPQRLAFNFVGTAGTNFSKGMVLAVSQTCLDTLAKLSIDLDDYANETSWELYNLADTSQPIEFGGGNYVNSTDANTTVETVFCLAAGNYAIVIYDSYGDGGPEYTVTAGSSTLVGTTAVSGYNSVSSFTIN